MHLKKKLNMSQPISNDLKDKAHGETEHHAATLLTEACSSESVRQNATQIGLYIYIYHFIDVSLKCYK